LAAIVTCAPASRASLRAIARPIPREPPELRAGGDGQLEAREMWGSGEEEEGGTHTKTRGLRARGILSEAVGVHAGSTEPGRGSWTRTRRLHQLADDVSLVTPPLHQRVDGQLPRAASASSAVPPQRIRPRPRSTIAHRAAARAVQPRTHLAKPLSSSTCAYDDLEVRTRSPRVCARSPLTLCPQPDARPPSRPLLTTLTTLSRPPHDSQRPARYPHSAHDERQPHFSHWLSRPRGATSRPGPLLLLGRPQLQGARRRLARVRHARPRGDHHIMLAHPQAPSASLPSVRSSSDGAS